MMKERTQYLKPKEHMEYFFNKEEPDLEYLNLKKYEDGSLYRGQIRKKTIKVNELEKTIIMREGYGLRDFPDGASYEGNWKDNMPSGKGIFKHANGDRYYGEFLKGMRHGEGEFT